MPKRTSTPIGKYLRELRVNAGYNTRQLERAMDMSQSTIWDVENGRRPTPALSTLLRYAMFFNVRLVELAKLAGYKLPGVTDEHKDV